MGMVKLDRGIHVDFAHLVMSLAKFFSKFQMKFGGVKCTPISMKFKQTYYSYQGGEINGKFQVMTERTPLIYAIMSKIYVCFYKS